MFEGFNESTIRYYQAIHQENSRASQKENETLYCEGVKYPLEELYLELYHYFQQMDDELVSKKRRCISTAYNDPRFSKDQPIKEYMYLHFKLPKSDNKNVLGFFFDASLEDYRYGLNIYHMDGRGMARVRESILDNKNSALKTIRKFNQRGLLELQGERYKRAHYPYEDTVLQEWLERKNISLSHEVSMNEDFFQRAMLDEMYCAYDSLKDVYFMLKEALED